MEIVPGLQAIPVGLKQFLLNLHILHHDPYAIVVIGNFPSKFTIEKKHHNGIWFHQIIRPHVHFEGDDEKAAEMIALFGDHGESFARIICQTTPIDFEVISVQESMMLAVPFGYYHSVEAKRGTTVIRWGIENLPSEPSY